MNIHNVNSIVKGVLAQTIKLANASAHKHNNIIIVQMLSSTFSFLIYLLLIDFNINQSYFYFLLLKENRKTPLRKMHKESNIELGYIFNGHIKCFVRSHQH